MRARLRTLAAEETGFTLVELLVAAAMGVLVMGAVVALVLGALKFEPGITGKAENVTTAGSALERMTRELRSGERIEVAEPSKVVFIAYERRSPCGSAIVLTASQPSIPCKITYSCTTSSCTRTEAPPNGGSGTTQTLVTGINSSQVFSYQPSSVAAKATYVKVTLRVPDPHGNGSLTVSDGASLRNATLAY